MMSASGIKPFLCETIDKSLMRSEWEKWYRSFVLYLESEEIIDAVKKKNKLLHLGGPQLQEVIFNIPGALVSCVTTGDDIVSEDVFKVLVKKLNEYFSPKRNSTFERHLFRTLKPDDGENFNKFLLRLRNQAAKCSFGETKQEICEINIKDKVIDAWASRDLKKRLLEKEHSLEEVLEMCQVHEQIASQTDSMAIIPSSSGINSIHPAHKRNGPNEDRECQRCGRMGHLSNSVYCAAKNSKCNSCGRLGHFAKKCKTKSDKRKNTFDDGFVHKKTRFGPSNIRFVEKGKSSDNQDEHYCFQVAEDFVESSSANIMCFIGNCKLLMLIDSGSRFNLIGEEDWEKLRQTSALINVRTESENRFRAYAAKEMLEVRTVFEAPISVDCRNESMASFYVIKNGKQSLLGRDTALKLKVLKLGVDINHLEDNRVFPKIKGIRVQLTIDKAFKQVQQPLRRIPSALEEKVENKLKDALEKEIIGLSTVQVHGSLL
ncbi:uncharacterized protein LOC129947595 [Eupeodes corollae]|uniref:uncharacterized protein LOC129947595 n=1 Tax=Eupeodes corollae TaxID=290404 RepID=UPI002493A5FC|nr:uncharacterized protein LOC129947595 [Eupeodes corollae]